jgi:ATP-binding cassette subfamily F protein 3
VAPAPHCGAEVARVEDVSFSYDGSREILAHVNLQINRGDKVAIVGYNGMGKTTLLRLLAGVRQPTSGQCVLGHKVIVGYQSQEYSETIPDDLSVLGCAKRAAPGQLEKILRTQLGSFGFKADDVHKPAGVLSGGEKIRLAFLQLFLNPPNFLLLDEPTTHLDLEGRRALEKALQKYDGTVCLVSHDVEFVRAVATSIIEISPAGPRRFPGGYDYYREKIAAVPTPPAAVSAPTLKTAAPDAAAAADPADAPAAATINARDLRRARAQERAKRQPLIRRLKDQVTHAEARIAELETEHARLTAGLAAGSDHVDYAGDSRRLKQIGFDLHKLTLEWETAAAELEQLEREQADAQEAIGGLRTTNLEANL